MASVLSQPSLALSSLKTRPTTIYLVLPAERLQTHARWLRLMVSMSLTTLARTRHKPEKPVLFVLDEFAAAGHLSPVQAALFQEAIDILAIANALRLSWGRHIPTDFQA